MLTNEVWPGDFNEDGVTDLVGEQRGGFPVTSSLLLLLGRGDGTFDVPTTIATNVGSPAGVGDVNVDGFSDIITTQGLIYGGRGDGSFAGPGFVGQIGAPTEFVDMNNDGRVDLLSKVNDQIFVYPGNGSFGFGTRTTLAGGFMVEAIVTGDFNGDGLRDIASTSKDVSARVSVFLNQGNMVFTVTVFFLSEDGGGITARDMNGDGVLDLAVGTGDYSSTFNRWSSGNVQQQRSVSGAITTHTSGPVAGAPVWLRLTMNNSLVTAAVSLDGSNWTTLGTAVINSVGGPVRVGLALTSHDDAALATATFDNVTITQDP